jgi:hypothetical protein
MVSGLGSLQAHILPARASLQGSIVSTLKDGLLVVVAPDSAFICLLVSAHMTPNSHLVIMERL